MNANDTLEKMKGFAAGAGKTFETAEGMTKRAVEGLRDEAGEVVERSAQCARNNLVSGIATAFIGGLIVGFALARRERPDFRKRYIAEPVEHAQEIALALLGPITQALRDQYGNARSAAREAADRVSDLHLDPEPILKRTRQFGRRLRFW